MNGSRHSDFLVANVFCVFVKFLSKHSELPLSTHVTLNHMTVTELSAVFSLFRWTLGLTLFRLSLFRDQTYNHVYKIVSDCLFGRMQCQQNPIQKAEFNQKHPQVRHSREQE